MILWSGTSKKKWSEIFFFSSIQVCKRNWDRIATDFNRNFVYSLKIMRFLWVLPLRCMLATAHVYWLVSQVNKSRPSRLIISFTYVLITVWKEHVFSISPSKSIRIYMNYSIHVASVRFDFIASTPKKKPTNKNAFYCDSIFKSMRELNKQNFFQTKSKCVRQRFENIIWKMHS